MKRLKTSIVAWSGAAALASFAILYQVIPYQNMLDLALSMALGASVAVVGRYSVDALSSFLSGRGGKDFLIVSIFAIVSIILIQRSWIILLEIYDRPQWMTQSAMTILIPWMVAWSVSLAMFAPDVDSYKEEGAWNLARSVAVFVAGTLAGFVIATSFRAEAKPELSYLQVWPQLANRAVCPPELPVWVSSRGVFHEEESPYRGMVIPDWCFATASDAEKKGFRAPKSIKPAD